MSLQHKCYAIGILCEMPATIATHVSLTPAPYPRPWPAAGGLCRRNRGRAAIAADNPFARNTNAAKQTVRLMILMLIVIPMSAILGAAAALHLYWAAGGLWPGRSPRRLIDTVIGNPRRNEMPPAWLSALVGVALAGIATLPIIIAPVFWVPLGLPFAVTWRAMDVAFWVALVFIARGIAGYLPFWRRIHSAEPFASLDVFLYSPLCLLLGLEFIFLDFVVLAAI